MAKIRVAVVFGGRSGEHAVSCLSAASVLRALDPDRYDVVPVGIAPDGRFMLAPNDPAALEAVGSQLPAVAPGPAVVLAGAEVVPLGPVPADRGLAADDPAGGLLPSAVDVVFPVLHGPYGEDGTIQGLLEMAGLPYVGSGVFASAAAMDKAHMKALLVAAGLPIGPYTAGRMPSPPAPPPGPPPWFVKPARAGSSLGISRVTDAADLPAAYAAAAEHDAKIVVESAVVGREIECGVLGGPHPRASLPAEIRVSAAHPFYDFTAKYLDASTELVVPAELDPDTTQRVQRLALQAFAALDCEGLARVDLWLQPDGGLLVNEVNTMPGFTHASLFPRMWAASGVPYAALVDTLIGLALDRGTGLH